MHCCTSSTKNCVETTIKYLYSMMCWLYFLIAPTLFRRPCPSAIVNSPKNHEVSWYFSTSPCQTRRHARNFNNNKQNNLGKHQSFPIKHSRSSHVHHHLWPQPRFPRNGTPSIIFWSSQQRKPICATHRSRTRSYQSHRHSSSNHWSCTPLQRRQRKIHHLLWISHYFNLHYH